MRSRDGLLVTALVCAAALIAIPGSVARAAVQGAAPQLPRLPIKALTQVIADGAHDHLFLDAATAVLVTSLGGQPVTALAGSAGATGMTMSGDGETLYLAVPGRGAVIAYSTKTLRSGHVYRLGPKRRPADVAVQSGRLWVSYTTAGGKPGVGDIAVAGSRVFVPAALPGPVWTAAPRLAADPLSEGTLIVINGGGSPRALASYRVAGPKPVLVARSAPGFACRSFAGMAVTPAGRQVVLACQGTANAARYSTATLKAAGAYRAGAAPDAVATALDGSVAAGTGKAGGGTVAVYNQGVKSAITARRFGASGDIVAPGGLAWTSDSTTLFAVVERPQAAGRTVAYYLDELSYPQFESTTLEVAAAGTATGTATVRIGGKVSLSGRLALGGKPAPAGVPVQLVRTRAASSAQAAFIVHTKAGGGFSLVDAPPAWGRYTYTAHFASDKLHEPAWHATFATVTPLSTMLAVEASPATVPAGKTVTVVAHLGRTYRSRVLGLYAQSAAGGHWTLIKKARVNGKGYLIAAVKVTRSTRFAAVFAGDAHYAPATAETTVTSE